MSSFIRLSCLDQIKQAIANNGPVELSIQNRSILLFGYDDESQCFYGDGWGTEVIGYQTVEAEFCQGQAEAWAKT